MAKPITFIPTEEYDENTRPDIDADESSAFDAFQDSFTGEQMGTLRVQRVPSEQQKSGQSKGSIKGTFLFACPVDKYSFDELMTYLRDEYGTGTYRIIGIKTGNRGIAFNRIIEIERSEMRASPVAASSSNQSDMAAVVTGLAGMIEQQTRRLTEMMTIRQSEQVDPIDQMEKMARLFAQMNGAFNGGGNSRGDLLEELMKVKQVADMMGMGDGGGRGANNADVFIELAKTFGPGLVSAVQAQARRPSPAAQIPASITPRNPPVENTPEVRQREMNPQNEFIRKQANQLLMFARADADTVTLATQIVDSVPDDKLDDLETLARDPAAINKMIAVLPPGNDQFKPWFEKLRVALIAEFDSMEFETGAEDESESQPENNPSENQGETAGDLPG